MHDRVLLRLMNSKLFSLACLARVGDCDAFLDGLGAERARVGGGGARRAHEEVSARLEEDGARALHAHDALGSVLRLVALAHRVVALRTSPISATSAANFTIIRGKRPPLDSVANPDEVRKALANSRHAWMLEEKDMFDRLKSTHAHSPPPRDP